MADLRSDKPSRQRRCYLLLVVASAVSPQIDELWLAQLQAAPRIKATFPHPQALGAIKPSRD